jgi:hypothetical protein
MPDTHYAEMPQHVRPAELVGDTTPGYYAR